MPKVRITKEFNFEMAHALYGYDGPCKHIHGHSYMLAVTLIGEILKDETHPKNGMVIDFGDIKQMVNELIINPLDHSLMLNANSPHKDLIEASHLGHQKQVLVNYQPTCENMVVDFAKTLINYLPPGLRLHHLLLRETPTSYAEWFAEDNK